MTQTRMGMVMMCGVLTLMRRGIGVVALVMAICVPALAQVGLAVPAEIDRTKMVGLVCVYEKVSQVDRNRVVDAYFSRDESERGALDTILSDAESACADEYSYSDAVAGIVRSYAVNTAIVDVLGADLVDAGVSDVGVVEDVWRGLSSPMRAGLLDRRWSMNTGMRARLQMALIDAGVPNRPGALTDGLIVLEASSHAARAIADWSVAVVSDEAR